jgi:hypothetical protein
VEDVVFRLFADDIIISIIQEIVVIGYNLKILIVIKDLERT